MGSFVSLTKSKYEYTTSYGHSNYSIITRYNPESKTTTKYHTYLVKRHYLTNHIISEIELFYYVNNNRVKEGHQHYINQFNIYHDKINEYKRFQDLFVNIS